MQKGHEEAENSGKHIKDISDTTLFEDYIAITTSYTAEMRDRDINRELNVQIQQLELRAKYARSKHEQETSLSKINTQLESLEAEQQISHLKVTSLEQELPTYLAIEQSLNRPYSDLSEASSKTNTQTDASHLTTIPTGIESNIEKDEKQMTINFRKLDNNQVYPILDRLRDLAASNRSNSVRKTMYEISVAMLNEAVENNEGKYYGSFKKAEKPTWNFPISCPLSGNKALQHFVTNTRQIIDTYSWYNREITEELNGFIEKIMTMVDNSRPSQEHLLI